MIVTECFDPQKLFRFHQYWHAVPLAPLEEMKFDPATAPGAELGILWLRPREKYPFYLRFLGRRHYNHKQLIPKHVVEGIGPGHRAAIAVLRTDFESDNYNFLRRTWYVAAWDAFHGHRALDDSKWYAKPYSCPCEAVKPQSIKANQPVVEGCNRGGRSSLRLWDENEPELRLLA